MKKVLLALLVLVSISGKAQIKREKFINTNVGGITFSYGRSIDLDKGDTTYMVFLLFQNAKYSSITDTKILSFYDAASIAMFIKDLKSAYKQMSSGEKIDISWNRDTYKMNLYNFSNSLYLYGDRPEGYTNVTLKSLSSILELFYTIDFGKVDKLPSKSIEEIMQ